MAIKFLRDYQVQGATPPESFTKDQVVKDRDAASELHFVRRGIAAYVGDDDQLFDHEGRKIEEKPVLEVTVTVADNRDGEVGRAGETHLIDGSPQRGSSGPGEVATTSNVTDGETIRARKPRG